jgi:hypothetical protein
MIKVSRDQVRSVGCRALEIDSWWLRIIAVLAASTLLLTLPVNGQEQEDRFVLSTPLLEAALAGCSEVEISGEARVGSAGLVSGDGLSAAGHVWSNGGLLLNGSVEVHGDAMAGPADAVDRRGNPLVTGAIGSLAESFSCSSIDLAALLTELEASNDNALIPETAKGKDPLGGRDGRELTVKANDSLSLPAGTYLLSKITLLSHAEIVIEGPVRILCTGEIKMTGGALVNQLGSPFDLRMWSSHDGRLKIDSQAVLRGLVFAPAAELQVTGGALKNRAR